MAIKKHAEDFILLAEAGFIAVNQADEEAATKLFQAAELLDPNNALPKLGFGYLHLHKLELQQSVQCFEKVLEKEPNNDMAKAFMGIAISLMPDKFDKGEKVLRTCLSSHDPSVKQLATSGIDFVERFVKKTPGPAGKNR